MTKSHEETPEEHKKKHHKDVQDLWEEIEKREGEIKEHERHKQSESEDADEDRAGEEE
jgi:hypothetical protein